MGMAMVMAGTGLPARAGKSDPEPGHLSHICPFSLSILNQLIVIMAFLDCDLSSSSGVFGSSCLPFELI